MTDDYLVPSAETGPGQWLIDGHVHIHDCFALERFLDAAAANFARAMNARGGVGCGTPGCLLLTESRGMNVLGRLRDGSERRDSGRRWKIRETDEAESLLAERADGVEVILVAGRQVVTVERLEVLALGCTGTFADGRPIEETVDAVLEADALAVIPWGFGKWWGARGRTVARMMERYGPGRIFLGDNGGRPALSLEPRLFGAAKALGVKIVPGTDPLPFPRFVRVPGRYGCVLSISPDRSRPAARVKQVLRENIGQPVRYGRGASLPSFVRAQVGMQLRARARSA